MRGFIFCGLPLLLLTLAGCERVRAPEIKPEQVTTAKITTQGADVETTLAVYNPNKSTLTANGVDTKVTLGGKPNVARAVVTDILTMPGGKRVSVKMPIKVVWLDAAAIAALAETKQPAEYVVEGTVHFAGTDAAVVTPFKVTGTMSAAELAQAAGTAAPEP